MTKSTILPSKEHVKSTEKPKIRPSVDNKKLNIRVYYCISAI